MSELIPLDLIRVDAETQVRVRIDETVVTNYSERMMAGATFKPIVLFHDGSRHYLADGFHRTLAAQRLSLVSIAADVQKGTREDALWFALGANREHGLQLGKEDKRHAIILALKTWPEKSQTAIADQIGCSQRWVSTIRDEVRTTSNLPERVTGKDGKSYPASRTAQPVTDAPLSDNSGPRSRSLERAKEMAAEGYTSRQIATELGVDRQSVVQRFRRNGLEAPVADKVVGKPRRFDHTRIISQIVDEFSSAASAIEMLNLQEIDCSQIAEWQQSLSRSGRALAGLVRQLKTLMGEQA